MFVYCFQNTLGIECGSVAAENFLCNKWYVQFVGFVWSVTYTPFHGQRDVNFCLKGNSNSLGLFILREPEHTQII